MKHIFSIILSLIFITTYAQKRDSVLESKLTLANQYLKGNGKPFEPSKAFILFKECAEVGNVRAMNTLGLMYKSGNGIDTNYSMAFQWLKRATDSGYAPALNSLASMYKDGFGTAINYEKAYECFKKSGDMGNVFGSYMQGYMHYKGLGCEQNYLTAFTLFRNAAYKKKVNAMYFLGLCFRNGYGTQANTDSATYWLKKADNLGYTQATDELAAQAPENLELAGSLANKIKEVQKLTKQNVAPNKYTKVEHSIATNEFEGNYTGYLLKYDWSGQHVVRVDKLDVSLVYDNGIVKGTWIENDTLSIPVNALMTPKALTFKGMQYGKKDHYDAIIPEVLSFQNASLQLIKDSNHVYLAGNIQLFSVNRKEPGKPYYVALTRTTSDTHKCSNQLINFVNENGSSIDYTNNFRAYPNPFTSLINMSFDLKETCQVNTQLLSQDGKVIYNNPAGTLSAGSYNLYIEAQQLFAGYYTLVLHYGNKAKIVKIIKL